jgi:hypothetical protein
VSLVFLGFFSLIVVSALDVRFGSSAVPTYISLIGEALIVLSFLFIFFAKLLEPLSKLRLRVDGLQMLNDFGCLIRNGNVSGIIFRKSTFLMLGLAASLFPRVKFWKQCCGF